jgi:lipopolysaccharide transport system ATP-binding protein
MSSEVAIRVEQISKCYEVYENPRHRLMQFMLPPLQTLSGMQPRQYYREFWALRDVSFEVTKGESVGIIGRNGSGKSTLLQIITGTLSPTSGQASTQGRIAALLELGSGFNPDFTGTENVLLNGTLLGLSHDEIDRKFDEIAAFADIGVHLDQPVKTYSSGMLVRLAFAVQVQVEPEILIVDEALAVGDALFQKRCFQRIEKLVSNGTTLLFVSHDQETVRTLTRRSLLLDRGRPRHWGRSADTVLEYRKLLHADETKYLADMAERAISQHFPVSTATEPQAELASRRLEFGDLEAIIKEVQILGENGQEQKVFNTMDIQVIRITIAIGRDLTHLNIGIRIRNKEGVKIFSWGTFNRDLAILAGVEVGEIFRDRNFSAGDEVTIEIMHACPIGTNLYEVQAYVCQEALPEPGGQRMLHWMDEAAFFTVSVKLREHYFGGVVDLNPTYRLV